MRLKAGIICLLQVAARQTGIHEPCLAQNDAANRLLATSLLHAVAKVAGRARNSTGTALRSLCIQLGAQWLREHRCPPDCGLDAATPGGSVCPHKPKKLQLPRQPLRFTPLEHQLSVAGEGSTRQSNKQRRNGPADQPARQPT